MTDQSKSEPSGESDNMPDSATPDATTPDANESYSPKIFLREKSVEERRESTRREYFVGVHIATDHDVAFGLSGNISAGGIFVVTEDLPTLGSRIELEFLLEGSTTLRVDGEVRWVHDQWNQDELQPPGFGAEFDDLDAAKREQLIALLDLLDA